MSGQIGRTALTALNGFIIKTNETTLTIRSHGFNSPEWIHPSSRAANSRCTRRTALTALNGFILILPPCPLPHRRTALTALNGFIRRPVPDKPSRRGARL